MSECMHSLDASCRNCGRSASNILGNKDAEIEKLRAEVEQAFDAIGICGVDEPMSLVEAAKALRARCEAAEGKIIQLNQIITTLQDNAND